MATSDYSSSIDLRLPLYPDTKPSYDIPVFTDINALFTAVRLLAEGVETQLATKVEEAPEDGQSYVRKDGEWVVASGGSGGAILPGPTTRTFLNNTTTTTGGMTNNAISVGRLLFPFDVKVTPQARVNTAVATSKFTAALYHADPITGLPGIRFADLGEVDCSSVGVKSLPQLDIPAGEYFLVWHQFSTANIYRAADVAAGNPLKQYDITTNTLINSYSGTATYAHPLPDPFTYTVTGGTGLFQTPIFFRIDSP